MLILFIKRKGPCAKNNKLFTQIFLSISNSKEFGRYASKPSKELYKNNYEIDKRSMFSRHEVKEEL
jgi:hypothetical protein